MRCEATARSTGRRCGLSAEPASRYCRHHGGRASGQEVARPRRKKRSGLPEGQVVEGEIDARGMEGEIALLRRRVREAADDGDWEAMRRGIETLCKALKVQYVLEGRSSESLSGSLSRVLEEVGNELGITL